MPTIPKGLGAGGRKLWRGISSAHDLDDAQLAQLEEACRAKDRCDKLDDVLRGEVETWVRFQLAEGDDDGVVYEVKIDAALAQANNTANLMKQLLAALRLPDEASGRRPQVRSARGSYKPPVAGGAPKPITSIERARLARAT
jgi:hypothetical protein